MKNLQHEDLLFFFMSSFWNIHFEPLISTGCSLVIVPITSSALEVTQVFQILVTSALHIYISLSLSLFFFWLHPQHMEVPEPGIEPAPQ